MITTKFLMIGALSVLISGINLLCDSIQNKELPKPPIEIWLSINNSSAFKVTPSVYGMATEKISFILNKKQDDKMTIDFENQLSPNLLRWPGGGLSTFYHWNKPGYGYIESEVKSINEKSYQNFIKQDFFNKKNPVTYRYFDKEIELAKRTKASLIVVANIITGTPHEFNDQLREINKQGVKIKAVELGNEMYLKQARTIITGPEKYLSICKPFADSIRKYFPQIPIGICAAPFTRIADEENSSASSNYFKNWNEVIAKDKWYDFYINHYYIPVQCQDNLNEIGKIFDCASSDVSELAESFLSNSFDYYQKIFGTNRKMYITEWNIAQTMTKGTYGNTLLQAIFITEFYNTINKENVKRNNLIEGATYFGMANGLLASSTIMLPWKNETFRDPIGGDIIRRTSFYSHILMKKIFNDETKMTSIEIKNNGSKNSNPAISFYSYFNATFNSNWIYFANKTGNEISLSEIIVDSKSKKNLTGQFYCLSGPSLYSSFGATKFEYEYKINEVCKWTEEKIAISNMKIPGYSTGCFEIKN